MPPPQATASGRSQGRSSVTVPADRAYLRTLIAAANEQERETKDAGYLRSGQPSADLRDYGSEGVVDRREYPEEDPLPSRRQTMPTRRLSNPVARPFSEAAAAGTLV
jgi:hypothetical protein